MKPHRPIDLDSLNKEFFSSEEESVNPKDNSEAASSESISGSDSELFEMLKDVKISEENPIFHDTDEEKSRENAENDNTVRFIIEDNSNEGVSEEDALRSFPDFEFNPEAFDTAEDGVDDDNGNTEPLRIIKESVEDKSEEEAELSDEEIAEQKKLEKIVRRPFRVKGFLSFLMVIFLFAGILAVAFEGALYKIGSKAESRITAGQYSVCYIEPSNIESSIMSDCVVILRKEIVSGNKTILFCHDSKYMIEDIVAIGEGICAVKIPQVDSPITVSNDSIEGVVIYSLKNIKPIYYAVHNSTIIVLVIDAVYFALVICFFAVLIKRQHRKIDALREQYQLVK